MRAVPISKHRFLDYFRGFENVRAVQEIFGDETSTVLSELEVEFFDSRFFYMAVNQEDGHLLISSYYLRTGSKRDIYLDVIHELVHVRQFREGRSIQENIEYVDRSTEIEAYGHSVSEARRLGMTDEEIVEYLTVPWLAEEKIRSLANHLGVRIRRGIALTSGPLKWPH